MTTDLEYPEDERYEGPLPYRWIGKEFLDLRDVLDMADASNEDEDEDEISEARYIKRVFEAQCWTDVDEYARNEPTLIHENYFETYAQELAEDIGAIDRNANWPLDRIDWKAAADDLKMDYTEYEIDGHTYYGRAY